MLLDTVDSWPLARGVSPPTVLPGNEVRDVACGSQLHATLALPYDRNRPAHARGGFTRPTVYYARVVNCCVPQNNVVPGIQGPRACSVLGAAHGGGCFGGNYEV